MNDNIIKTFHTEYVYEFNEYLDSFIVDLKKNCNEYYSTLDKIEYLKKEYPKLRDLLENNKYSNLNEKEVSALFKIFDFESDLRTLEYRELFFKGSTEAINYLRKLDIL